MSHQNSTIQPDFSINEALKIIRKEKKFSYQALADKCGVSKGYIYQIEKGTSDPTLGVVYKLCKVLGVSLPDLIDIKLNNINSSDLHPHACILEKCLHCLRIVSENHNPKTCSLCNFEDWEEKEEVKDE